MATLSLLPTEALVQEWRGLLSRVPGARPFSSPGWAACWWQALGSGEPDLLAVRKDGLLVGIAPLHRQGNTITLIGDREVCDYLDVLALPSEEVRVAAALLEHLTRGGQPWDFQPLLPDSFLLTYLLPALQKADIPYQREAIDVTTWLDLPGSWQEYLSLLEGKARHELRRKLRRFYRAGRMELRTEASAEGLPLFLELFQMSPEKARFLTPEREHFFRCLAQALSREGWLRLWFLSLDGVTVAACLGLDYGDTVYLYNSGYHPDYAELSVGLVSKALCLEQAIAQGKRRFDFLRGAEAYKEDLGGKQVPVYRLRSDQGGNR